MKIFKKFTFFIDYSTQISINSLASGGSAPRTPYKCIFPNFLNFYPHFRQEFEKNFKIFFKKSRNFLENFLKIVIFHWFFLQILWKLLRHPGGSAPGIPHSGDPFTSTPLVDLAPPRKIPAGANVNNAFLQFS